MIAMPKKWRGRVERQVFKMFVHRWPKLHMKSNSCLHAFHVAMVAGVKQTSCQQYATEKDWDKCWSQNVTNMAYILFKNIYTYINPNIACVKVRKVSVQLVIDLRTWTWTQYAGLSRHYTERWHTPVCAQENQ